jgi:TolB-like protein
MLILNQEAVMKRTLCLFFALSITFSAGAQSLERGIRVLTEEISRGFLEGSEELLIKPRIGVADFEEESAGAAEHSVGSLVSALLTRELGRSTIFSVIERRSLDTLMEEFKLSLSGLADEATAPRMGMLQGVELLLLGSVTEAGDRYIVTARLVEIETGRVTASAGMELDRREIEQEAERYLASTFQAPYGISLAPAASVLLEIGGAGNYFLLFSVDAGYRVSDWLAFSLGYAHIGSSEMKGLDEANISVTDDESLVHPDVTRYFRFTGDGIQLAATASLSPSPRLSLGTRLAAILYFHAVLEQDLTEFPVWQPDGAGGLIIASDRIIVEGFNHELYASYHLSFSADYLVSRRLSLFGRVGAFLLPEYIPTSFRSAGRVQDNTIESDADIDENGTFPQYQDFNFAESSTGERIGFSAMGVSAQFALAADF